MNGTFVFKLVRNKYFVLSVGLCPSLRHLSVTASLISVVHQCGHINGVCGCLCVCVYVHAGLAICTLYQNVSQYKAKDSYVWDKTIRLYLMIDYLILTVTAYSYLRRVVVVGWCYWSQTLLQVDGMISQMTLCSCF